MNTRNTLGDFSKSFYDVSGESRIVTIIVILKTVLIRSGTIAVYLRSQSPHMTGQ